MKKTTILAIISWVFIWFVISIIVGSMPTTINIGFGPSQNVILLFIFGAILGSLVFMKHFEK